MNGQEFHERMIATAEALERRFSKYTLAYLLAQETTILPWMTGGAEAIAAAEAKLFADAQGMEKTSRMRAGNKRAAKLIADIDAGRLPKKPKRRRRVKR